MNEFSKKENKQTNKQQLNRNIVFYVVSRAIKNDSREFQVISSVSIIYWEGYIPWTKVTPSMSPKEPGVTVVFSSSFSNF